MKLQDAVNKMIMGVLKQGQPAITGTMACRYRTKSGRKTLKCAMGQIIPSKMYDPLMEGTSITSAAMQPVLRHLGLADSTYMVVLGRVQSAHDAAATAKSPRGFKRQFMRNVQAGLNILDDYVGPPITIPKAARRYLPKE